MKPRPLPCAYCGAPTTAKNQACEDHNDLPALDKQAPPCRKS